jgi:bifunctional DNA-binding transcriptional regulator/antitoxin component of YhaV-PrlF toxin-antitoxin module
MEKLTNQNVRKLTKSGSGSYYAILPKGMIKELGWKERQKLKIKKVGKRIIIKDWE